MATHHELPSCHLTMKNLAIFASGNGSNFQAIAEACASGAIQARVALLIVDKPNAGAIARAEKLNIPVQVVLPKSFESKAHYEAHIVQLLNPLSIDLVCLAGYMRIVGQTLLEAYPNKIVNIHPALLPAFKGAHAITDAFNFGVKVYGVTVHLIDDTVDGGTIVAQRAFEYHGKDIELIESRIHAIEHVLYVEAINTLLES